MKDKKMTIETRTRKVKQSVRKFTKEQRLQIIYEIDNRPPGVKISVMFEKFGLGKSGGLYYNWKKMYGIKSPVRVRASVSVSKPIKVQVVRRVTVSVNVTSLKELFDTCTQIQKISKVKILDIEVE